jgi:hypothetical protein
MLIKLSVFLRCLDWQIGFVLFEYLTGLDKPVSRYAEISELVFEPRVIRTSSYNSGTLSHFIPL